jgi:nucleoside-diphosphate-sugar epimerase
MKRALILGCGYAGARLAQRLIEAGCAVVGTTRSEARGVELEAMGVRPVVGDLTQRGVLRELDRLGPEVVFYFIPPAEEGEDPLPKVLAATARAPLEAFVYASSTSVYGDRGGDWVDETDLARPEGRSAEARLAAERIVIGAGWNYQTPTRICRITGIYGPGRTLRGPLERGDYLLIRGADTWVNRIHVDDLASGLIAAWRRGGDSRVYNMADDEPHRASEFACLAADLHGLPRPQWVDEEEAAERLSESRLRRKTGSKRVRNWRLREELEVKLTYPTFREGLPAAVEEGDR